MGLIFVMGDMAFFIQSKVINDTCEQRLFGWLKRDANHDLGIKGCWFKPCFSQTFFALMSDM